MRHWRRPRKRGGSYIGPFHGPQAGCHLGLSPCSPRCALSKPAISLSDALPWIQDRGWTHWGTLTYRNEQSEESARRKIEGWLRYAAPSEALWVTEKGARFGRVHHHVLLRFNQRDLWDDTHAATRALVRWEDWKLGYGIAEIDEYDPKRGAAAYLTGYTIKQTYDWDLWVSR